MTEWMNAEGFVNLICMMGSQWGTVEREPDDWCVRAGAVHPPSLGVLICEILHS